MSIVRRSNIYDPFSLDLWDPFDGRCPFFNNNNNNVLYIPRETTLIDWKETVEAHVFTIDLPGVKKEDVKVKVEVEEGRVLQISGERSQEKEKNDIWHRVERSIGKFFRRFRLPKNAKVDQAKANMENGVLTVTVPKEEEEEEVTKKPKMKSIEIK